MAERAHGRLCGWGGQWRHVTSGRAAQEIKAANSKRRQVEEQMEQLRQREGALASRVEMQKEEFQRRLSLAEEKQLLRVRLLVCVCV